MASMEDLIATISGGLHAGPQGNDLRDLQATLAQTLNPVPHPHYRPIPPPNASSTSSTGPLPPPAPASSWNTPPLNTGYLFSSSPTPKSFARAGSPCGVSAYGGGSGTTKHDSGFSVPMPNGGSISGSGPRPIQEMPQQEAEAEQRPYHAAVLPVKASPKDTGGFKDDAFKPLWDGKEKQPWSGFMQTGTR
ncbi:hypothetical protein IAR55_002771 [Kwoniella newhampshirensis]|uniref:Uncharacterized protein n=1 Tax=Kwoniella newhampshirensis TaxID=1651941 RepID=A0AAW0Z007_9TREE